MGVFLAQSHRKNTTHAVILRPLLIYLPAVNPAVVSGAMAKSTSAAATASAVVSVGLRPSSCLMARPSDAA